MWLPRSAPSKACLRHRAAAAAPLESPCRWSLPAAAASPVSRLALWILQDTDDEQDNKEIEAVPFPRNEQPKDKDELQAGGRANRFISVPVFALQAPPALQPF